MLEGFVKRCTFKEIRLRGMYKGILQQEKTVKHLIYKEVVKRTYIPDILYLYPRHT
jgi:hypothetical protein